MNLGKIESIPVVKAVGVRVLKVHQFVYERSGGRIGHRLAGTRSLLLRTVGAKTGQPRTNALTYVRDGADYVVVASMGGAPRSPGWYHNLRPVRTPRSRSGRGGPGDRASRSARRSRPRPPVAPRGREQRRPVPRLPEADHPSHPSGRAVPALTVRPPPLAPIARSSSGGGPSGEAGPMPATYRGRGGSGAAAQPGRPPARGDRRATADVPVWCGRRSASSSGERPNILSPASRAGRRGWRTRWPRAAAATAVAVTSRSPSGRGVPPPRLATRPGPRRAGADVTGPGDCRPRRAPPGAALHRAPAAPAGPPIGPRTAFHLARFIPAGKINHTRREADLTEVPAGRRS